MKKGSIMGIVSNEKIREFFLQYEKIEKNKYTKNQTIRFLTKAANKYDAEIKSEKVSKSIIRSNIIYKNDIIGFLNGVRPSSTSNEAVTFSRNSTAIIDYLKLLGIDVNQNVQFPFNIRIGIVEGIYSGASLILPPFIIGDGKTTIEELIHNKNEVRKLSAYFRDSLIIIDDELINELQESDMSRDTVLSTNEVYILKNVFNIKSGSESLDVTNELSGALKSSALNITAALPGLYTAGINISTDDYLNSDNFKFNSILVSPSPAVHYLPYKGNSAKVYEDFINTLVIRFKARNNIALSEIEKNIVDSMSDFQDLKEKYFSKLDEIKLSESDIAKSSKDSISKLQSNKAIESSKESRDKIKNNIVINDSVFKKVDNNNAINVTKTNVLRLIKPRKDSVKIAENALENEIEPFPGFESVNFDENYYHTDKTKSYGASYQLYIQSLRIVAVLLSEYEKNKNIRYLYKAEELIYSWISYVNKGTKEPMVWYDHPTANRTQVLVQFLFLAQNVDIDINYKLFRSILDKHGEVLSNDEKYVNNNHGLMMDKSLMVLGNVLGEEKFFIKGYYRSVDTFWYSFSSQGTHLENSPDYHNMVVRMYDELQKYLVSNGKTYNDNILGYLSMAKNYLNVIMKPNSKLPPIGDSGNPLRKTKKSYKNFYDQESGLAVLQYNDEKTFYINFVCGYSSVTHKHKDDLSINLNYNGEDFLTDAGKYNYNGKSPIRKYVISPSAHSSFQLRDHKYSLKRDNRFKRKISLNGYNFTDDISIVKGKHADYSTAEVVLNREVIQINKLPIAIIYDYIDNEKKLNYNFVQNYNLSDNITVDFVNDIYRLNGEKESMVLKPLLEVDNHEVIKGDMNIPIAVNTIGFSKVVESTQIKFHKNSSDLNMFLTAIYDDSVISDIQLINLGNNLELKINGEFYTINL